jgi:hypothetical protein
MKNQMMNTRKILYILFFFFLPCAAFAAPDIYVCGSGQVTLKYTGGHTLVAGDKVIWQEVDASGTPLPAVGAVSKTYSGNATDTDYLLTGTTDLTSAGDHYYRAHVVTADPAQCSGDVSTAIDVYMLPTFTVDLTPASATYCADGTTNNTKTVVTAAATPASALPTGVVFSYDWAGSNGGTVDGTDASKYNMTTTTVGSYTVTAKADFNVTATGKPLKSSAGGCGQSGSTTIKVAAKPGTPTISVS